MAKKKAVKKTKKKTTKKVTKKAKKKVAKKKSPGSKTKEAMRSEIVFARVTKANKKWLEEHCAKRDLSCSTYVNLHLNEQRLAAKNAKNRKPQSTDRITADFR